MLFFGWVWDILQRLRNSQKMLAKLKHWSITYWKGDCGCFYTNFFSNLINLLRIKNKLETKTNTRTPNDQNEAKNGTNQSEFECVGLLYWHQQRSLEKTKTNPKIRNDNKIHLFFANKFKRNMKKIQCVGLWPTAVI